MKITYTKTAEEERTLQEGDILFAREQLFTVFLDRIATSYKVLMTTCSHSVWKEFPGPTQGGNNDRDIDKIVIITIDDHHHKLAVRVHWKYWPKAATAILGYKDFFVDKHRETDDL